MQPPLTRPGLNRSALVGLLAELALVDHTPAPPSFVEGLAHWLGWKEAIPLSAALQGPAPARASAPDRARTLAATATSTNSSTTAAEEDYQRVHQALTRAIADTSSTAREDGASFVPYRRRYFSLQQAMDGAIGPLRTRLRAAMAQHSAQQLSPPFSPPLSRLVALDAAMATALASREQSLLATLPVLLEKHFSRLRQAALEDPKAQPAAAHPARPPQPAWLARFCHDMQRLLLAELDLRLQPALGLLETLQAAHPKTPVS